VRRLPLWTLIALIAAAAGTTAAQQRSGTPLFRGTSFLLTTYSSTQTGAIYGAFGRGPVAGLIGVVRNARLDQRVVLVGVGTRVRLGARDGLSVFAALADGSGGRMIRFYLLPSVRMRRLRLNGTTTTYVPLEAAGRWRSSVDPLTLTYRVTDVLGAGIATVAKMGAGQSTSFGFGPATWVRVWGVTARTELVRLNAPGRTEGRVTVAMAF
jgi:hypothetical protein